jgi:hypothetical protein
MEIVDHYHLEVTSKITKLSKKLKIIIHISNTNLKCQLKIERDFLNLYKM